MPIPVDRDAKEDGLALNTSQMETEVHDGKVRLTAGHIARLGAFYNPLFTRETYDFRPSIPHGRLAATHGLSNRLSAVAT